MSSNESDVEMQTALPKKPLKKTPKSPTIDILKKQDSKEKQESKKISTKEMVHQALVELKSRKGTSLYAIKKYIKERYEVDVEKLNYLIKKSIKTSIELGTIVQVKGVGAAGSFKLAPGKEKSEKKKKTPQESKKIKETSKSDKPKMKTVKKVESIEKKTAMKEKKVEMVKSKEVEMVKSKKVEMVKSKKIDKKDSDVKKKTSGKKEKAMKTKMAKVSHTPAKKKAAMMKRKSIGSIIKPPKMKPKAKA